MLEFAHPWLLILLPLPLLAYWLLPVYKESKDSVQVPFFQRLVKLTGEKPGKGAVVLQRMLFQRIWLAAAWLLIVLAMMRPEWVGEPIERTKSARDLMVAVDLSGSMDTTDFSAPDGAKITRLNAVKSVLKEFVDQREHDRLGLIVFGDAAYLQSPFTEDHDAWMALLRETEIGMAGQSTVFGDAIGLSIKLFENAETENRVLIVLTDGNDTGSKVPPIDAAKVAHQYGINIYTIAVGDPETTGEEALDLEVLERIAELTDGGFYQALDRKQLEQAYGAINELEPEEFESLSYRPRRTLHYYPTGLVIGTYLLFFSAMTISSLNQRRRDRHA
jgi:Ca-activated chloride channel family protein